jgi:hypothetical protein
MQALSRKRPNHGTKIMATDSDKPTAPPAAPTDKPAPKPDRPPEKRKFPRDGGGGPRRRERDAVPSLDQEFLQHHKNAPNVRDLDAEIAAELEAALQGMDDKSLYSADDSKRARDQAAAQGTAAARSARSSPSTPPTSSSKSPAAAARAS